MSIPSRPRLAPSRDGRCIISVRLMTVEISLRRRALIAERLEFTHFLTVKVHLTPINKGWCALSQVKWAFSPGKKKLRALGLPLPLRSFAMSQRQFSASNCLLELPSAGLEDMTANPCTPEEVWRRPPPAQSRHASLSEARMKGAKQM